MSSFRSLKRSRAVPSPAVYYQPEEWELKEYPSQQQPVLATITNNNPSQVPAGSCTDYVVQIGQLIQRAQGFDSADSFYRVNDFIPLRTTWLQDADVLRARLNKKMSGCTELENQALTEGYRILNILNHNILYRVPIRASQSLRFHNFIDDYVDAVVLEKTQPEPAKLWTSFSSGGNSGQNSPRSPRPWSAEPINPYLQSVESNQSQEEEQEEPITLSRSPEPPGQAQDLVSMMFSEPVLQTRVTDVSPEQLHDYIYYVLRNINPDDAENADLLSDLTPGLNDQATVGDYLREFINAYDLYKQEQQGKEQQEEEEESTGSESE